MMSSSFSNETHKAGLILASLAGKVVEPTDIARSDKALLCVNEGSLYFPVLYNNQEVGGIFIGAGQVLVDAIIETNRGAFGKSHEFLWNGSLLLITEDGKWNPPIVSPATREDLQIFLLDSAEEAQRNAQEIFWRFRYNNRHWTIDTFIQRHRGWIATILDKQRGKCGIIASDDRLVVKLDKLKVVISGNKLVQTEGRKKVVIAGRGGPVIRFG